MESLREVMFMAIRPVELQVNIPRTTELSKANGDEKQKNAAFLQGQSDKMLQQSNEKLQKVLNKEKVETLNIKKDKQDGKEKIQKKKEDIKKDGKREHVIDIEI
jgi:accessory colonization factor AcfC